MQLLCRREHHVIAHDAEIAALVLCLFSPHKGDDREAGSRERSGRWMYPVYWVSNTSCLLLL